MEKEPCSYFEIQDLGVDPYGNPCPALLKINITFKEGTPEDIIRSIVSEMIHVEADRISMISEEQYLKECYEEDDEDE